MKCFCVLIIAEVVIVSDTMCKACVQAVYLYTGTMMFSYRFMTLLSKSYITIQYASPISGRNHILAYHHR